MWEGRREGRRWKGVEGCEVCEWGGGMVVGVKVEGGIGRRGREESGGVEGVW